MYRSGLLIIKPIIVIITLLLLPTCISKRPDHEIGPPGQKYNMTFNGMERSYLIFTPSSYDPDIPTPLVVGLHGGGSDSEGMQNFSAFNRVGEEEGFLVVYPDAYEKNWNDGRNADHPAHIENIDDVGFIRILIANLRQEYNIDISRIYLTGASNGAMMTYRMACEATDLFAAFAPVIGNLPKPLKNTCTPSGPAPMIIMNGTDDPLVPYDGGPVTGGNKDLGKVLSTNDTMNIWINNNGCSSTLTESLTINDKKLDGTELYIYEYSTDCRNHPVKLYKFDGAGHTWPGGAQYLSRWMIGKVSEEIDATEVIWDFFKSKQR